MKTVKLQEGNVVEGVLLGRKIIDGNHLPAIKYYEIKLKSSCDVVVGATKETLQNERAQKGEVVSLFSLGSLTKLEKLCDALAEFPELQSTFLTFDVRVEIGPRVSSRDDRSFRVANTHLSIRRKRAGKSS